MLVAVVSDIHDNLANLDACLRWCAGRSITKMICCGDVCSQETLDRLAAEFAGDIFLVRGNGELYRESDLSKNKNISYLGDMGCIEIDSLNIGLCHEPEKVDRLTENFSTLDFIFFGHTHKPWIEKRGKIYLANPGNIAGVFYQASFAVLDTAKKELELKLMAYL